MNQKIDRRLATGVVTGIITGLVMCASLLLAMAWGTTAAQGQAWDAGNSADATAEIPVTVHYMPIISVPDPNLPTPTPPIPSATPDPLATIRPPAGEPPATSVAPSGPTNTPVSGASPTPYFSKVTPRPTATATAGPSPTPTATATQGPSPTPSPTLTPRPQSKFGIETNNLVRSGQPMFNAGSNWARRNALIWYDVEPTQGERRWSAVKTLELEMIEAARLQINFVLIIRGTPLWAQETPGSWCGPIAQDKLNDFAAFVYEVVQRYSAPPYNVKYYEFGNEPDVLTHKNPVWFYGCWADAHDPVYRGGQKYATMLKAIYPEVKAADPNSKVIIGGMLASCSPLNPGTQDCSYTRFFEGIMLGGGGPFFDVVSFHTYDFYFQTPGTWGNNDWKTGYDTLGPSVVSKSRYFRKVLHDYGFSNKILMDTEAALLCWMCPPRQDYETAKAWYVPELYATSIAEGVITFWYSFEGWENSGLVNASLQPLPALTAWKLAREKLGPTTYIGPVTSVDIGNASGVVGYKFRDGDRTVWLIRSLKAATRTITLPSTPTAITDPLGVAQSINTNITLTLKPLYIEWGN